MKDQTSILVRGLLLLALSFELSAFPQSTGDVQLGVKSASGPLSPVWVTKTASRALGWDSGGNLTALSISGGAWGSITGTLSAQTDLQTALDAKLASATAASTYQPLDSDLTSIGSLANASGVLTNNGSGTFTYTGTASEPWTTDATGKLVKYDTAGGLVGSTLTVGDNVKNASLDGVGLQLNSALDDSLTSYGGNGWLYTGPTGGTITVTHADPSSNAYSLLIPAESGTFLTTASQSTGGDGANDDGKLATYQSSGSLYASNFVTGQTGSTNAIYMTQTNVRFVQGASRLYLAPPGTINAGNYTLSLPAITANATVISTNDTGTVTNAMLAGSITNAKLSNSSITIAGTATSLGGTITLDTITGLASTGLIKRSGANTLAIATAGTDYVVPGGALGTPSSGTLTSCSGLPVSGITASTSTALGVGSIELGHATDTTLARSSAGVATLEGAQIATLSAAQTFTAAQTITLSSGTTALTLTPSTNGSNVLRLNLAAGTAILQAGNLSGNTTYGALYFGNVTPSSSNYVLAANGTGRVYLNAQTGDTVNIAVNDSARVTISSTTSTIKGDVVLDKTVTAAGTAGAQTINKSTGSVNFAAGATSLVVTNSLCTTSSVIVATIATNDATAAGLKAVAGSGSFTLYLGTAPTAETRVNFLLTN